MESFLQFDEHNINSLYFMICRNPYFNGILSAILNKNEIEIINKRRNPYFIGIISAILICFIFMKTKMSRNPYFNGILSAILIKIVN